MPSLLKILTDPGDFPFYGGGEFKQKNLPYDSVAGGGPSAQPAVVKPIPESEAVGSRNPDFLLRGGSNWGSALGDDLTRITKFFGSPEGVNFAIKQNILPIILPSISQNGTRSITYDAANAAEIFSQVSRNAYSPISTLAQVAVGAINGIHFDKSLTGNKAQTYSNINNVASPTPVGEKYSIQPDTTSNLEKKGRPVTVKELTKEKTILEVSNKYDGEGKSYSNVSKVARPKEVGETYSLKADTISRVSGSIPNGVQVLDATTTLSTLTNTYSDRQKFSTGSREDVYGLSYLISASSGPGFPAIGKFDDIAKTGVVFKGDNPLSGSLRTQLQGKDLIEFSIQVISNESPTQTDYIFFRAYLDNLSDAFTAAWDPYKFVGRGESFYNYTGFTRGINLNFKVYCGESAEYLAPTYEKLNYLVSTMTPDYSSTGYPRANLLKLTIGGYVKNIPGFITSLNFNIPVEYGWDIESTKKPRFIDVTSFAFTPIHTQLPRKGTPLIN